MLPLHSKDGVKGDDFKPGIKIRSRLATWIRYVIQLLPFFEVNIILWFSYVDWNNRSLYCRQILSDAGSRNLFCFLLLNLSFAFVELAYGIWTNRYVCQWSFIKIRAMWHWVLIVHISENFNCFSSVSVLYRIRFICSLIALPYWLVWLLQLFHGGKKMKHFHMGIVLLISILAVFYLYCMLLCLLTLLHCAGSLCAFDSQLDSKI